MKRFSLYILSALIIFCLCACQNTTVIDGEAVSNSDLTEGESIGEEHEAPETEVENEAAEVETPEETEPDEAEKVEEPEEAEADETEADETENAEVTEDEPVAETEVKEEDKTETVDEPVIIEEEKPEIKTEAKNAVENKDEIRLVSANGQYEYNTYSFLEPAVLKVKLVNGYGETVSESVEISWHQCNENGDLIHYIDDPVGFGDTFEGNAFQMGSNVEPGYYYATAGGIYERKLKSDIFKVTPEYRYKIVSEDGRNEYRIYNPNETVELKVKIVNSDGETVEAGGFQWFLCREDGEVLYTGGGSIAEGDTYICNDEYYKFYYNKDNIRYYRVYAGVKDENSFVLSSIFKVELVHPEGKTESDYRVVPDNVQLEHTINSLDEDVELKVKLVDSNGVPSEPLDGIVNWYSCYEDGTDRYIGDGYGPAWCDWGFGETFTLDGDFLNFIYSNEPFPIHFYAAAATKDGFLVKSDVFKVSLAESVAAAETEVQIESIFE